METLYLLATDETSGGAKLSKYLADNPEISIDITGGIFFNTALLEAVTLMNAVAVRNLILEGADMCAVNIDGDTPLIISCRLGCKVVTQLLL